MSARSELVQKEAQEVAAQRRVAVQTPAVDIYENSEELLLCAEMPGVEKEEMTVTLEEGKLSLVGVRKGDRAGAVGWEEYGAVEYRRQFSVPQTIEASKVTAELSGGVLRLHLPISEAIKPKQIEVRAG